MFGFILSVNQQFEIIKNNFCGMKVIIIIPIVMVMVVVMIVMVVIIVMVVVMVC